MPELARASEQSHELTHALSLVQSTSFAAQVEEPIHESPVQRPPPPPPPPQPSSSAETLLGSHPVAADDDEEAAAEDAHRQVSAGPAGAPQAAVPEGIAV